MACRCIQQAECVAWLALRTGGSGDCRYGQLMSRAYRQMVPDLNRGVGGVCALENGIWTLAAADADDAGHPHVLIAAQCSHAHNF